jgi:hypothetical protein
MTSSERRVPAAAGGEMERGMLRLLMRERHSIGGEGDVLVCGLLVRFSTEGDADVSWELRTAKPDGQERRLGGAWRPLWRRWRGR